MSKLTFEESAQKLLKGVTSAKKVRKALSVAKHHLSLLNSPWPDKQEILNRNNQRKWIAMLEEKLSKL